MVRWLILLLLLAGPALGKTIRVMTFNTHGADVRAFLKEADCDLILLQEASPLELPGYQVVRADKLVVLSRLPVASQRRLKGLCERRDGLEVVVQAGDAKLRVIAVHYVTAEPNQSLSTARDKKAYLKQTLEIRERQTRRVRALLDERPTLVGGDFNTPLVDLKPLHETGGGPTFGPLTIDHLFTSLVVRSARALDCDLSDHRPVVAVLELP